MRTTSLLERALEARNLETNIVGDAPEVPPVEDFVRRAYHASVVVGNYVYIDGGEFNLAPYENGSPYGQILHSTLSIDMSESWTNDTVEFRLIKKNGAPDLNAQILWPSTDNRTFYAFGGSQSFWAETIDPPAVSAWQFTADDSGGGSWEQLSAADNSVFADLTRPDFAKGVAIQNTGFIFGGHTSARSSPETASMEGATAIPGIVSFNITSGLWSNDTVPERIQEQIGFQVAPYGAFSSAPFGPDGVLIMTRGMSPNLYSPPPFNSITIYDPSDKTWHSQTATGSIPSARRVTCTVGVQGDNGTYEVFVYGGYHGGTTGTTNGNISLAQYEENVALDEVHVLSLPAFAWFKADYPARHPRRRHTCHVVGNRQMLSIGGLNPNRVYNNTIFPDPFKQGLGIFDLTAMQWSDRYDANAEPYVTPQIIKDWYEANGTSPQAWDDPAVRRLFQIRTRDNTNDNGKSSNSTTSGSGSSSIGAIVGGVLGGVVAVGLICALLFWFFRWRKSRSVEGGQYATPYSQKQGEYEQYQRSELPDNAKMYPQELPMEHPELPTRGDKLYSHEMPDNCRPSELASVQSPVGMHTAHSNREHNGG
ncbi:MAG: hypothetical protein Q9183_001787 [Haloplaca sp. 2 TL-2023]